jgi:hypothetical protein
VEGGGVEGGGRTEGTNVSTIKRTSSSSCNSLI